jgi:hypothetical protein
MLIKVVHAPSNPPGWSAGKWGEWYPDILDDGKLTVAKPKPYRQTGWLKQHDRLMQSMAAMNGRIPMVVSGGLHAIGLGRMLRAGALDFRARTITTMLPGRDWHAASRLAVGGSGHQTHATGSSRPARGRHAHRAARVHARGLPARSQRRAAVPMGRDDPAAGRHRHAGAVPYRRAREGGGQAEISLVYAESCA